MRTRLSLMLLALIALTAATLGSIVAIAATPGTADACSPPYRQLTINPSLGLEPGEAFVLEGSGFFDVEFNEPDPGVPVDSCGGQTFVPAGEHAVLWLDANGGQQLGTVTGSEFTFKGVVPSNAATGNASVVVDSWSVDITVGTVCQIDGKRVPCLPEPCLVTVADETLPCPPEPCVLHAIEADETLPCPPEPCVVNVAAIDAKPWCPPPCGAAASSAVWCPHPCDYAETVLHGPCQTVCEYADYVVDGRCFPIFLPTVAIDPVYYYADEEELVDETTTVPTTSTESDTNASESGSDDAAAGSSAQSFNYDPILPWTGNDDVAGIANTDEATPSQGAGSTAAASDTSQGLAYTGSETGPLGYLGAGLVALGALALAGRRKVG